MGTGKHQMTDFEKSQAQQADAEPRVRKALRYNYKHLIKWIPMILTSDKLSTRLTECHLLCFFGGNYAKREVFEA